VLLSRGEELGVDDIPQEILGSRAPAAAASPGSGESLLFCLPPGGVDFEQLERSLVEQALKRTRGNQTRASRLLGMNREQIRYRVEKFGLRELLESKDE
jgi:DNA-binding NtrC family response regulator